MDRIPTGEIGKVGETVSILLSRIAAVILGSTKELQKLDFSSYLTNVITEYIQGMCI